MVKKINKHAILIKELLEKGWNQEKIANFLKLGKKQLHFWATHEIKIYHNKKIKLKDIYVGRIIAQT